MEHGRAPELADHAESLISREGRGQAVDTKYESMRILPDLQVLKRFCRGLHSSSLLPASQSAARCQSGLPPLSPGALQRFIQMGFGRNHFILDSLKHMWREVTVGVCKNAPERAGFLGQLVNMSAPPWSFCFQFSECFGPLHRNVIRYPVPDRGHLSNKAEFLYHDVCKFVAYTPFAVYHIDPHFRIFEMANPLKQPMLVRVCR